MLNAILHKGQTPLTMLIYLYEGRDNDQLQKLLQDTCR